MTLLFCIDDYFFYFVIGCRPVEGNIDLLKKDNKSDS
jgi:hypothetical protein